MAAFSKAIQALECRVLAYSVEKLHAEIWLENLKALERPKFEGVEGPTTFHDLEAQLLLRCQTAYLRLVFSHKLIFLQNPRCGEKEFFNRIGREAPDTLPKSRHSARKIQAHR